MDYKNKIILTKVAYFSMIYYRISFQDPILISANVIPTSRVHAFTTCYCCKKRYEVGAASSGITVISDFMKTYFLSDLNYTKSYESGNAMLQLIVSVNMKSVALLILE
jgi:hypothetical protein